MNIQAWNCFTDNKTIEIVNTWYNGLYLFIDNVLVVKNDSLYALSSKKPLISVKYLFGNVEKTIDEKLNAYECYDSENIETIIDIANELVNVLDVEVVDKTGIEDYEGFIKRIV
ncbi:hypothetical protein FACS189468_4940 [Spirochaetia bacterium]|nr:hypothetical protein FACS189468_4940 [Spirochaetia bacterium]